MFQPRLPFDLFLTDQNLTDHILFHQVQFYLVEFDLFLTEQNLTDHIQFDQVRFYLVQFDLFLTEQNLTDQNTCTLGCIHIITSTEDHGSMDNVV